MTASLFLDTATVHSGVDLVFAERLALFWAAAGSNAVNANSGGWRPGPHLTCGPTLVHAASVPAPATFKSVIDSLVINTLIKSIWQMYSKVGI